MSLRYNSITGRMEEVGDLVGSLNGVQLTAPEYNAAKAAGTSGLAENSIIDTISNKTTDWFTPQGTAGTSTGGNIMNAVGTGVGALTGLAGAYYTKKNYDLQKANQQYLQNREAQSDARKSQFAANAGNSATY